MTAAKRPQCDDCGGELACRSCDDTRPLATDLDEGWWVRTSSYLGVTEESVVLRGATKAAARSELMRRAREIGKLLKVHVSVEQ